MQSPTRLAVIPAAGAGRRALHLTRYVPKPLLRVGGKPLIVGNLELLRDQCGIENFLVITGEAGHLITDTLGSGASLGISINYHSCPEPSDGLATGLLGLERLVDAPFLVVLADEVYLGSRHDRLLENADEWFASCGVIDTDRRDRLRKNYRVDSEDGLVTHLAEKPEDVSAGQLGVGSWHFTPSIFRYLRHTPPNARSGKVELVDAIGAAVAEGEAVRAVNIGGEYVNVNTAADRNTANHLVRSASFDRQKVSVVIPAYGEEAVIEATVREFVDSPLVDEVLVVDNSSPDRTAELARAAGARVETVKKLGYGDTIAWGLDNAKGSILVVTEADNTFRSQDLGKLLEYLKDADMVIGTRTDRQLVEPGTNMEGLVRVVNILVGKMVEALWWRHLARFTDVGCTYRAIWRDAWEVIRPDVAGTGPEFAPEMMIESLRHRLRVIEIPVTYARRPAGESKHSAGYRGLSRTASRMLKLIARKRISSTFRSKPPVNSG